MTLQEVLNGIPDPRSRHGRRHPLGAVLGLAVCAMLAGARSLYAISQWGRDQGAPLTAALGFTRSTTPSVATLHRVFRRLDREAFEALLGSWLQERGLGPGEALAVDGKTLRGVHGEELPGIHLVAAYAHRSGVVVGQQAAAGKGQELAAARALLERLPLQGQVVTGDAQFAQRDLSRLVVGKGGAYFWVVKENQPTLRQDIADVWDLEPLPPPQAVQTGRHGDRWEERRFWASEALVGYSDWPHLIQVCRVERIVTRKGKTSQDVAYAVTSLPSERTSPQQLLTLWRGHWGIENRVHWVRDVTFDEDRCSVRTGAAPQVLAALRNLAISLLRQAGHRAIAPVLRRHAAHPREALALLGVFHHPSRQ